MKPEKNNKKILVLIDSHAVLHRAFHALPNFTSPKGEPTGALYGFASFIIKILRELKPDYMAACFDLPGPTFRHEEYKDYKAKRPKIDDALVSQINKSRELLKAFGIPVYDAKGYEADDILGTIVEKIKEQPSSRESVKIIIASGDMDTFQLVDDDRVVVYTLKKGIQESAIYDESEVVARYGFKPEFIPDFKGLKGDPSDNILGVPGVGEKTATYLVKKFGTIQNLYEQVDKSDLKEKMKNHLKEHKDEAFFSKELANIRRDAPIDFKLEDLKWTDGEARKKKITDELNNLGFKSLLARFNGRETPKIKERNIDDSEESELKSKLGHSVPEKFLEEVEIPLLGILKEMKEKGILVDVKYLEELSEKYHRELSRLEKKIWKMAGEEFNINSPKQLGVVLFETMGIEGKGIRMTATGNYSTDISQLAKLKGEHKIIEEIISYREMAKLLSTYVDAFPKMVDGENRLHTTFDTAGTSTGRISSSDPNLQNIPIRTELGMNIRRAFIAPKGRKLLALDYSQIELRVLAILSGDPKLVSIFKKGEDVHTAVAVEVFGVSPDGVTPEMRRRAKVINFGIIYGMGVNALKQSLGTSQSEAREFYNNYFNRFPKVFEYMENIKKEAYERGYTETLFGRRRYFPEIRSRIQYVKASAERMAMNAPLQGSAADFIKLAMVNAENALAKKGLNEKTGLLLQIHDELVYETDEGFVPAAASIVSYEMEHVWSGGVPLKVHIQAGSNLKDLKDL